MGNMNPPTSSLEQEAAQNAAMPSDFYAAAGNFVAKTVSVAADRYKLLTPTDGAVKIAGTIYYWYQQQTLDLSLEASWDTIVGTDYRTAGQRAGKDFYVYWVPPTDTTTTPKLLASINSSAPADYTTANSRLVDGFHGLCVAVAHETTLTAWAADTVIALGETRKPTVWNGKIIRCTARAGDFKTNPTTEPNVAGAAVGATLVDDQITWIVEQHSLEGYVAGDILPASVWDLKKRPTSSPVSMFYDGAGWWLDIYYQSGSEATTSNAYNGTITVSRTLFNFIRDQLSKGKSLPEPGQLMRAAQGSNFQSAAAGGAMPTTTGGKSDVYGRRMVSNLGMEDFYGSHLETVRNPGYVTSWSAICIGMNWAGAAGGGIWGISQTALATDSGAAYITARGCAPSLST